MKKITLFLSAMLFSVMSFAGLGEGYSKVTDITTLSAGDKVVLYSDDAELGITGWDGTKTATAATDGWVEYVVETAEGGVLLQDGEQYISLTTKNTFTYKTTGSVCKVTADGILYITLEGTDYLLYENANNGSPLYRMYADKTGNSQYKPFYVYEVGEGGGETPDTPVDPEEPETPVDPENPGTPEEPETPVGSIDGYSKVTNAASLVAGDKVVLYCDDAQLGVTGWNGNKDATVAESGWVEYVVEVADGGFYLKDGEQYITGAESANHFKYGEKAVCGVDKDGVLACGTKFLYKNGDYYRMYTDKSSNNAYKPFYVYKAGEGGGETPEPEDPEQPEDPDQPENPDPEQPEEPETPVTPAGEVTFDADVDKGNASEDSANQTEYTVEKDGVTMVVSKGIIGVYNNENHYRVYKSETLTITSTVGNIVSVEFTCTANDDAKYGPGCFAVDGGDYTYSGAVGTWTGSASEVVFTATTNQVRATQVVVTLGEGGGETPEPEDPEQPENPDTPQTGTTITGLNYADAIYVEDAEYGNYWVFDLYNDYDYEAYDYIYPDLYVEVYEAHSKTAINGTYDVLYTEYLTSADADAITTDVYAEDFVGTLTIKNVDNEGNYSFKGSFTAANGKTYTYDQVVNVNAYAYSEVDGEPMYEDIELNENGTTPENPDPEYPENPETPAGEVTFDADVDMGDASLDANNQTPYTVSKDGLTLNVSKGIIGVYNNENHYRVYKNETLTITSTIGNIVSVEFTCTANDDEKYGPGCFIVNGGSYTYSGAVGTWNGSATEIVFTATSNQVRATEIVVTVEEGTAVDNVFVGDTPVKVIKNAQMYIMQGNKVYTIMGTQVK